MHRRGVQSDAGGGRFEKGAQCATAELNKGGSARVRTHTYTAKIAHQTIRSRPEHQDLSSSSNTYADSLFSFSQQLRSPPHQLIQSQGAIQRPPHTLALKAAFKVFRPKVGVGSDLGVQLGARGS